MPNLSSQQTTLSLDSSGLVDAAEAAKVLSVPKSWIYDHTKRNAIPHRRLGKYVRFSVMELLAWTQRGCPATWRSEDDAHGKAKKREQTRSGHKV